jgi:ParB/RepB/Spo0J family partition protein
MATQFAPKARPASSITREIPLALLLEPLDPMRHNMDDEAMLELQASIRENGLYENLCVVPVVPAEADTWERIAVKDVDQHIRAGGRFRVAAGHRRLLACRVVQYDPVKCEIFVDLALTEETIMAGENTHREDPTDFDLAVLYNKWLQEPDLTEDALKRRAGKTLDFIYARANILNGYKEVADALHARKISFSVARAINSCDEADYAMHFLNMAIDQGASTKIVNAWIKEREAFKAQQVPAPPGGPTPIQAPAPTFQKVECCVCGDPQSYNLQVVYACGACKERIAAARQAAEEAATEPQT